ERTVPGGLTASAARPPARAARLHGPRWGHGSNRVPTGGRVERSPPPSARSGRDVSAAGRRAGGPTALEDRPTALEDRSTALERRAVPVRRRAHHLAEPLTERRRRPEARLPRDPLHRVVAVLQQVLGAPHPGPQQPLHRRGARLLAEPAAEGALAHPRARRHRTQGDLPG